MGVLRNFLKSHIKYLLWSLLQQGPSPDVEKKPSVTETVDLSHLLKKF